MGKPKIPERKQKEVLIDLLESIALEETALAHLVNAEAEKIQDVLKSCADTKELLVVQDSVNQTLRNVIKKEMLLQFKLEDILRVKEKWNKDC